jgi:hypothetical protein
MAGYTVRTRIRSGVLAGATLVVLGALGLGLSIGARGPGEAKAQAGDPETAATLGLFRRERTARDEMPGDPVAMLQQTGDAQQGEDPSLSRRVDVAGSTRPAFLWPMAKGVCYSAPEGGSGCVPTAHIRDAGMEVVVSSAIRRTDLRYLYVRVFGIARDGVSSATLTFADGGEVQAVVRDNVFFAHLTDMPEQVRWQDSRGMHTERVTGGFDSLEQFRSP